MRTRKDQTDVPNTCQYIDEIIDTLKIYVTDDDELNEALKYCEIIRTHNSTLRDFGNDTYYEKEDLEKRVDELNDRISDLQFDNRELREENDNYEEKLENALDEIYELKSELEDLKLSKYND